MIQGLVMPFFKNARRLVGNLLDKTENGCIINLERYSNRGKQAPLKPIASRIAEAALIQNIVAPLQGVGKGRRMNHSEQVNELSAALSAAQAEFKPVKKTGKNPHLGNVYATLDDVIASVRDALGKHGLAFLQPLGNTPDGVVLETVILHKSGQWLSTSALIPALAGNRGVNELQAFGGALTYMRRYMLAAMLGVASDEDDDANGAKPTKSKQAPPEQPTPKAEHWTADNETVTKFWDWVTKQEVTEEAVYKALGVADLTEYTGTKAEAVQAIKDYTAS